MVAPRRADNATLALGNIHVSSSISNHITSTTRKLRAVSRCAAPFTGSGIDTRLSGTGVDVTGSSWTAAAGGSTGNKTVTLTGTSAGAVNSTVNIVNNFANTNSQTLTITGGVYQYAQATLIPKFGDFCQPACRRRGLAGGQHHQHEYRCAEPAIRSC